MGPFPHMSHPVSPICQKLILFFGSPRWWRHNSHGDWHDCALSAHLDLELPMHNEPPLPLEPQGHLEIGGGRAHRNRNSDRANVWAETRVGDATLSRLPPRRPPPNAPPPPPLAVSKRTSSSRCACREMPFHLETKKVANAPFFPYAATPFLPYVTGRVLFCLLERPEASAAETMGSGVWHLDGDEWGGAGGC